MSLKDPPSAANSTGTSSSIKGFNSCTHGIFWATPMTKDEKKTEINLKIDFLFVTTDFVRTALEL